MKTRTVTVVLSAPKAAVFSYLADVENLPKWATEFVQELLVVDGKQKVRNPRGEFFVQIRADQPTGVIDFLAGPSEDELGVFPTRVIDLPGGLCAYTFTMIQGPGMSDERFEEDHRALQREFEGLELEFSP